MADSMHKMHHRVCIFFGDFFFFFLLLLSVARADQQPRSPRYINKVYDIYEYIGTPAWMCGGHWAPTMYLQRFSSSKIMALLEACCIDKSCNVTFIRVLRSRCVLTHRMCVFRTYCIRCNGTWQTGNTAATAIYAYAHSSINTLLIDFHSVWLLSCFWRDDYVFTIRCHDSVR